MSRPGRSGPGGPATPPGPRDGGQSPHPGARRVRAGGPSGWPGGGGTGPGSRSPVRPTGRPSPPGAPRSARRGQHTRPGPGDRGHRHAGPQQHGQHQLRHGVARLPPRPPNAWSSAPRGQPLVEVEAAEGGSEARVRRTAGRQKWSSESTPSASVAAVGARERPVARDRTPAGAGGTAPVGVPWPRSGGRLRPRHRPGPGGQDVGHGQVDVLALAAGQPRGARRPRKWRRPPPPPPRPDRPPGLPGTEGAARHRGPAAPAQAW